MAFPELPEPMNSSPYHSKVRITTALSDPTFVAGNFISGRLEMDCRADKGLGIGILMVELLATQGFVKSIQMNRKIDLLNRTVISRPFCDFYFSSYSSSVSRSRFAPFERSTSTYNARRSSSTPTLLSG